MQHWGKLLLALSMLVLCTGPVQAQEWNYQSYDRSGVPAGKGTVQLRESGAGTHALRFIVPNMDACLRAELPAEVRHAGGNLIIDAKPLFGGCDPVRLVIKGDGSGGQRHFLASSGQWSWDGKQRGLNRIGTASRPGASPNVAAAPASSAAPVTPVAKPSPATPVRPADNTKDLLTALQQQVEELKSQRAAAPAPQRASAGVPRLTARALVIGNGKYTSFGSLANPVADARAMAKKFESFGIAVDLVLDAERDDLIKALNEYARKSAGAEINILYYAGHGVQVEGSNYLIPVNMRADSINAGYVKLAGISLNAALDYLPAKTRLVFLDACRDNPAARSLNTTRGGAGSAGLAPVSAASGTLIAYSTRDGSTADDGVGPNSPYTAALLQHIDKPVDISLVLRQVRQTVLRTTSGRQEPWEYGSLVGEQIVLPLMAR